MEIATQTHLTTLRGLLSFRLHELQTEVHAAELARRNRDGGGEVTDRKDDAAHAMLTDVTDTEDRLHQAEMNEVKNALRRLDEGTFGDCVDCGEPIPLQRLLVQPAALRCTACQTAGERAA
ncbi:MAG: TraR/DksA family transcriptional regulator [Burkholderiales bacterium]